MSLSGVNYTTFSQSASAQNAIKLAIIRLFPRLRPDNIRIVPKEVTSSSRRLEDGTFVLGRWEMRKLVSTSVQFDIVISTTAQELGVTTANVTAAGIQAFDAVTTALQDSVDSGAFAQQVAQFAPVLQGASVGQFTAVNAITTQVVQAAEPTGQPTRRPTAQPTCQPTRQPSGQPSARPSGQPSTAPSNPPTISFVIIDLEFVLQSDFPRGSKFNIFIPQAAKSQQSFPCDIIQKTAAMRMGLWSPRWFGNNQTLELTALVNFPPGRQAFGVGSADMVLKETSIYQDDSSLTYSLFDNAVGEHILGGVFDKVVARGLVDSSLSYDPPLLGSITSMQLGFVSERPMLPNDRVYVYLPGFSGVEEGLAMNMLGIGAGTFTARWNSRINAIMFTITSPVSALNLSIPSSLGFRLSVKGSNNYTGIPTIALRTHNWGDVVSKGYHYFVPTPFKRFTPVAFVVYSRLSFASPAVAGQATSLYIDIGYSLGVRVQDVFNVTLPRFWSTSQSGLSVTSNTGGTYKATWLPCEEVLMLEATADVDHTYVNVTVVGMRLPADGVSVDLAKHINVTTSARSGTLTSTTMNSVQFVGKFTSATLSFRGTTSAVFWGHSGSAGELSSTLTVQNTASGTVTSGMTIPAATRSGTVTLSSCSITLGIGSCTLSFAQTIPRFSNLTASRELGQLAGSATNVVNLTFALSSSLESSEVVSLYMPGVSVVTPVTLTEYYPGTMLARGSNAYSASWISASSTLKFAAISYIAPNTATTLVVSGVTLPTTGFPQAPLSVATIATDAALGAVVAEVVHAYAGFKEAAVHYQLKDVSEPLGLRFRFVLTGAVVVSDTISFKTPIVTASSTTALSLMGDLAEDDFVSYFDGSFNPTTSVFTFTAKASVENLRELNIHVGVENKVYLLKNHTASAPHTVSGSFASLGGTIAAQSISYYPSSLLSYSVGNPGVNMSTCSVGKSCAMQFDIDLRSSLRQGEHLTLSHPNLVRIVDANEKATYQSQLTLYGNSTMYFAGSWRAGDNTNSLSLASNEIAVESTGRLTSATDHELHTTNLTIPSSFVGNNTIVVTTIPRVITYFVDWPEEFVSQKAVCGDNIGFQVRFTEAVQVLQHVALKLRLSTKESARYMSGNGTDTLRFIYNVVNPTDASDLRVMGAGAMEYDGPAQVVRLGHPSVFANVTMSPPYGRLIRSKGQFSGLSVACAGSAIVTKIEQYVYDAPQDAYRVGDILDIRVTFDRNIRAVGSPALLLSSSMSDSAQVMVAKYANVSYSQWLDVADQGPAKFSLSLSGDFTSCLDWNDTKSLMRELRSFKSLQNSLPLRYRKYALANGIRYMFTFSHVAPYLLTVPKLRCDLETTAKTYLDPKSGNFSVAVFRLDVKTNDSASILTYPNTSAIVMGASDYLYVAGLPKTKRVDGTLPLPTAHNSGLINNSQIAINGFVPSVVSVSGSYDGIDLGEPAESGDSVMIYVNYSQPVVVYGTPLLLLRFNSFIDGATTGQTLFTRYAPFAYLGPTWPGAGIVSSSVVVFEYKVQPGDSVTDQLNYYSSDSLVLNGGSIRLASLQPVAPANLKLPSPLDQSLSLYKSQIKVSATQAPALQSIYTDHPPGVYGIGEEIIVYLQFDSVVHVQFNASTSLTNIVVEASSFSNLLTIKTVTSGIAASGMQLSGPGIEGIVFITCPAAYSVISDCGGAVTCTCTLSTDTLDIADGVTLSAKMVATASSAKPRLARPTIPLAVPLNAHMVYTSGSASNVLAFTYKVSEGDNSFISWMWPSMGSWNLTLAGGYFMAARDSLQNNYWNYINTAPSNLTQLLEVEINSAQPVILRVNSSSPDGVYYPGQAVDITVVWNKKVMITAASQLSLPSVIIEVPHFDGADHIATYSHGNASSSLSFKFVVPVVPEALRSIVTPRLHFDYAGTASLLLNGCVIREVTTNPMKEASYYLPARSESYLAYERNIFIQLTVPMVERVFAHINSSVATAGDVLLITVKFSQKVMVFQPPVLRLATGKVHQNAIYASGNRTDSLVFSYAIQLGDQSAPAGLDYVDTRLPPYNNVQYSTLVSFALSTDVQPEGLSGRQIGHDGVPRSDDINLAQSNTIFGGIFQLVGEDGKLVPANMALPFPGSPGSLSESKVIVDTSSPFVTKVFTNMANGVYARGVTIPIILRWSAPVTVSGCPILIFRIQGRDRPATFAGGSGTADTIFAFTVMTTDIGSEIDYADRFSLHLQGCNSTQDEDSQVFVRRAAAVPTVDCNLTLPWVRYVESVVAPTSLSGSGNLITLSGPYAAPQMLWTSMSASRTYSVGDIVDINVGFTFSVAMPNSTYMVLGDQSEGFGRRVYYGSSNGTTATFPLVVQADEAFAGLSYNGSDALRTAQNCDIFDVANRFCAAQNLPAPFSSLGSSADELSLKNLSITSTRVLLSVASVEMLLTIVDLGEEDEQGTVLGVPVAKAGGPASDFCDSSGASWLYSEYLDTQNSKRVILTTGCPNHRAVCQKASCSNNGSGSDAITRSLRVEVPLVPLFAKKPENVTCTLGQVAVAHNGVPIYSQSDDAKCTDAVAARSGQLDSCGGRSDSEHIYRYHVSPACLLRQLGNPSAPAVAHSPQVGWAMDGFPVYGPYSVRGLAIAPCSNYKPKRNSTGGLLVPPPAFCLDECNGMSGAMPSVDSYLYRYYISGPPADGQCDPNILQTCDRGEDNPCCLQASAIPDASYRPYTIGCLKGCRQGDYSCVRASTGSGVVSSGFSPSLSSAPTVVYDGSPGTVQSAVLSTTTDPKRYLPSSTWDTVRIVPSSSVSADRRTLRAGDVARFAVTMTEAVYVEGQPSLTLQFLSGEKRDVSTSVSALFAAVVNETTLIFELPISAQSPAGIVMCSHSSALRPSGARILKVANFLPLLPAELSLGSACCQGPECLPTVMAEVLPLPPRITRIFSSEMETVRMYTGATYSSPEEVNILVEFSEAVVVTGSLGLALALPGYPQAQYIRKYNSRTLLFRYIVRPQDFAASLEVASIDALSVSSGAKFDGVFSQGAFVAVAADLTLPTPGSPNSLGRQAMLIIDNDRPRLLDMMTSPDHVTSGDYFTVDLMYDQPMQLFLNGDAISYQDQDPPLLQLHLSIVPTGSGVRDKAATRFAKLVSVHGSKVSFQLLCTPSDPSGTVVLGSPTPVIFAQGVSLLAASNHAPGPVTFPGALQGLVMTAVDNEKPVVVSVSSPNTTAVYPWGTGDLIDIYVVMSTAVVVGSWPEPVLLLSLGGALDGPSTPATYVKPRAKPLQPQQSQQQQQQQQQQQFVTSLHFQYRVRTGDSAVPLEYASSFALVADVRRYSSTAALLPANLTLARPFTHGSLGFCCNVQVDTTPPYVRALMPLKTAGVYGEGEELLILARFNKPVVVTGYPYLQLNVGTWTLDAGSSEATSGIRIGTANYTKQQSPSVLQDLLIDLQPTDVFFQYTVRLQDNVATLTHAGTDALHVPAGASILHATNRPEVHADTTLREPGDYRIVKGEVIQQWVFNFASKVELLLRDLYHTDASSLSVRLEHKGRSASVFDRPCPGMEFGRSYPGTRLGNNATMLPIDLAIGESYLFSDTLLPNIALTGSVEQSSTQYEARRAIDGKTFSIVDDGSVSETLTENQPWWLLQLPVGSVVQALDIWPRSSQQWVSPLIALTIRGLEGYAQGTFRLRVSDFLLNPTDPLKIATLDVSVVTEALPFNATAAAVKKALEAAGGGRVGSVAVDRELLQQCNANGGGCGSGVPRGYGYQYSLSFVDLMVAAPAVEVVEPVFLGGPVANAAGGEKQNVMPFQLQSDVAVQRLGRFINSADVRYSSSAQATPDMLGEPGVNEWLTPFAVMFFNERPPDDLETSLALAQLSFTVKTIDTVEHISLQAPIKANYIKIQRLGFGSLALAEVEVFPERVASLANYVLGSPIKASPVTSSYQPEESFSHTFSGLEYSGQWLAVIEQHVGSSPRQTQEGWSGDMGTISEAVLVVTDLIGLVHTYYQDLSAVVTSLPRHGALQATGPAIVSGYGNWREALEVTSAGELAVRPGGWLRLGYCYGRESSEQRDFSWGNGRSREPGAYYWCPESFGQGPQLESLRVAGPAAEERFLRGERLVMYQPRIGFLGPDAFSYVVYDGLNVQTHAVGGSINPIGSKNEVGIHVRYCRAYAAALSRGTSLPLEIHPLCACAQSQRLVVGGVNSTACMAGRMDLCSDPSTRGQFINVCLACSSVLTNSSSAVGFAKPVESAECAVQTMRAVGFVTSRGLCSSKPAMDCVADISTSEGPDAEGYTSIGPAGGGDYFSPLGDSLGGQGWYRSAPLG